MGIPSNTGSSGRSNGGASATVRDSDFRPGETVVFAWIIYKSRADRDRILKKVMADPRLKGMNDPSKMPFDAKRMIYGGFKVMVDA